LVPLYPIVVLDNRDVEWLGWWASCGVVGGKLRRLSPAVDLASGFFSLTVAFVVVV